MMNRILDSLASFLPATVVVAIFLFILRESLEAVRRRRRDRRKRTAIRTLLAQECERNNWTIHVLRKMSEQIEAELSQGAKFELVHDIHNVPSLRTTRRRGSFEQTPIPRAHRSMADKFMMHAAMVDEAGFSKLLPAHEAPAELEHVRNSPLI